MRYAFEASNGCLPNIFLIKVFDPTKLLIVCMTSSNVCDCTYINSGLLPKLSMKEAFYYFLNLFLISCRHFDKA